MATLTLYIHEYTVAVVVRTKVEPIRPFYWKQERLTVAGRCLDNFAKNCANSSCETHREGAPECYAYGRL